MAALRTLLSAVIVASFALLAGMLLYFCVMVAQYGPDVLECDDPDCNPCGTVLVSPR